MRLLGVDDDPVIRELLTLSLNAIGYEEVELAASGQQAIDRIERASAAFDCILLDISMPSVSGLDLIPMIKRMPGYARVPIVMLTALGDRGRIAQAFAAGAWDYIKKPFEIFELEARLYALEMWQADARRRFDMTAKSQEPAPSAAKIDADPKGTWPKANTGQDHAIGVQAFENCVLRTLESPEPVLDVFLLEVADFARTTARLDRADRASYVAELTQQLAHGYGAAEGMVTYRGDGHFMALSFDADGVKEDRLTQITQNAAQAADRRFLSAGAQSTVFRAVSVSARELPVDAEPTFILHEVEQRLARMKSTRSPASVGGRP